MKNLIIIPVYNDWESVNHLVSNFQILYNPTYYDVLVVNDGSTKPLINSPSQNEYNVLDLNQNIGHQRAIAIGLCVAYEKMANYDYVIIMDGDGEDRPEDIQSLLAIAKKNQEIVFAKRARRHEGLIFKLLYFFYKLIFRILIGKTIDFGNFSVIPRHSLHRIISNPNLWNHYSGSIIKSNLQYSTIECDRGKRYFGKSKMNLVSLVVHGLSAISIHFETITVRIMLASLFFIAVLLCAVLSITVFTFITDYELSIWISLAFLGVFLVTISIAAVTLLFSLNILISRSRVYLGPVHFYKKFIANYKNN